MAELEQTLVSTEIADMIEKSHSNLIRDIRRYIEQFNEGNIPYFEFFKGLKKYLTVCGHNVIFKMWTQTERR